jgi:uncharacterized protein (DUF302 family)
VPDPTQPDIVEHLAPMDFDATVARLTQAIAASGLMLFARIDHAAGARDAGLAMPPATVLIYGHARGGTPVMLAEPLAALDLPLRVLVRQRDDGRTVIAFHPVAPMLARLGVSAALAGRVQPAQDLLVKAVSA